MTLKKIAFERIHGCLMQFAGRLSVPNQSHLQSVFIQEPFQILLIAFWFGLTTGLTEVAYFAFQRLVLHQIVNANLDIVWMAPLADMLIMAIPGLALFLAARTLSRSISLNVVIFVQALLSFWSLLLLFSWLQGLAALLLAVGLAAQATRVVAKHPAGFFSLLKRTGEWLPLRRRSLGDREPLPSDPVAANAASLSRREFLLSTGTTLVGLCVGIQGWQALNQWRVLENLPPALPNLPNVLLVVLDTVRAQNLNLYGYSRRTSPQLERLAKFGVLFDRAVSTSSWTLPSHASMFTGRYPHDLSANWTKPLDGAYPTLAEILSQNGYETAGFVANLVYCGSQQGLNRGFSYYKDFPLSPGQLILSSPLTQAMSDHGWLRGALGYHDILNRKSAEEINSEFLQWLARRERRRPFFAFLNYFDAHEPYLPPPPFDTIFGPKRPRDDFSYQGDEVVREDKWAMSAAEVQTELDAYDGSIAYVDSQIGSLWDELRRRGVLENTLVIIVADHGEQFGEHRLFSHGNSLYWQTLHVPLLILFPPHVPAETRVGDAISLRDLGATVLDLVGLRDHFKFPGRSLVRYWQSDSLATPSFNEPHLSELSGGFGLAPWYPKVKGDMQSLVNDRYHYILNGDGGEELYDLRTDPSELHNLANTSDGRQSIARFRDSLRVLLQPTSAGQAKLK